MLQNGAPMIIGGTPVTENGGIPQLASIKEVNENEDKEPPLTMATPPAAGSAAASSRRRRRKK